MVSDFRKKKLLHVFSRFYDTDGSGTIEKKDFEISIDRITKARGWNEGDEKYNWVKDTLLKVWDGLSHEDINNDGSISEDEWIAIWERFRSKPFGAEWQNLYCKFAFTLQDSTGDGAIDSEEFSSLMVGFGLNKDDAVAAFKKLSQGKDSISWPEFQELWKEYFISDDVNAPGNSVFGKTSF